MKSTEHKVLILGGAGFVGSSLAIGLKKHHPNWQITCLDNLKRRGSELNLSRFREHHIEFTHGDIRSSSDLDAEVFDIDTIIDCSAEPSVLAGFSSPQYVLQTDDCRLDPNYLRPAEGTSVKKRQDYFDKCRQR